MAGRPEKHNANYFPHDNCMRNDSKIKSVRVRFGIEGYAVYNMLLESLTESNMLMIPNAVIEIETLSGDFGIDSDKLKEMLIYFQKINIIKLTNKFITCPQLEQRLKCVFDKRHTKLIDLRENYYKLNGIIEAEIEVTQCDNKIKEKKQGEIVKDRECTYKHPGINKTGKIREIDIEPAMYLIKLKEQIIEQKPKLWKWYQDVFLKTIKDVIPDRSFQVWFKDTIPMEVKNNKLIIFVGKEHDKIWVNEHYAATIKDTLKEIRKNTIKYKNRIPVFYELTCQLPNGK